MITDKLRNSTIEFFSFVESSNFVKIRNQMTNVWEEKNNTLFRENIEILISNLGANLIKIQNKAREKMEILLEAEIPR